MTNEAALTESQAVAEITAKLRAERIATLRTTILTAQAELDAFGALETPAPANFNPTSPRGTP